MRKISGLLAIGAFTLAPTSAHALTGFYAGSADGPAVNHAANVVLMRDGKRTVLAMENDYVGPVQDFVLVVPVPFVVRKETVRTLPREVFAHLDAVTAPRLVEYWEQDPCATTATHPPATPRGSDTLFKPGEAHGVNTDAQFAVGEYDVVILGTKDSAGLDAWLRAAKYKLPTNAETLFRPYVERGMKFFVAKVDPKKVKFEGGRAILSPLRFSYDAETLELPLRLGALSSDGSQELVVTILAKGQRYEAANLPNVAIPTNLDLTDAAKAQFGAFYASLFDRTVEKNPRAAITEYAWDVTSCDACTSTALTPSELATLGADSIPGAVVSCDPPFRIDGDGHKRQKPECLVGFPKAPEVTRGGGKKSADEHADDFVMSRLHLRYGKDPLPDDLVFRAGAPLAGGREIVGPDNTLEHGAQAAKTNHFQARYAVRHAWAGAIACKEPHRGNWGGPPPGTKVDALAKAALEVAFAPHGTSPVDALVSPASIKDLDGLAIAQPAMPVKALVADASPDAASASLPTDEAKAGCKACTLQSSSASSSPAGLALLGLALLGWRRRR
ncbi:MAG: DUF2330 domain-containing protein [Polyangiaceae bacterium]